MRLFHRSERTPKPLSSPHATKLGEDAQDRNGKTSWGRLVVAFMRVVAVLWIFQGLLHWAAVFLPEQSLFDRVSAVRASAVVFFGVLDLVAGVGLWLATPWGGAIWVLAALSQILAAVLLPGFFSPFWIGADIVLLCVYFFLTWQATRAAKAKPPRPISR